MAEALDDVDSAAGGPRPRGPIEYLGAHPTVRDLCAAAAFSTSLYAIRRSKRPATKLKRAAWTALAALTAVEGAGLFAVLPAAHMSRVAGEAASS